MLRFQYKTYINSGITKWGIFSAKSGYFYYAIHTLVNAAWNVVRNNATFKAYYDAKRAEGRTHYNALGHCSGKLVRVIWKMLTEEIKFNLE